MARANYVAKAKKDIWSIGVEVKKTHSKGKNKGLEYTAYDKSKQSDVSEDTLLVAKGEAYYWWQFMYGSKQVSKVAPKASQLTQSEFLSTVYAINERLEELSFGGSDNDEAEYVEAVGNELDEIKEEIETLKEETDGKRDNMPEGLYDSPTGELLGERVEALDDLYNSLDGIDVEDYGDNYKTAEQYVREDNATDIEAGELTDEALAELIEERKDEVSEELMEEIHSFSYEGE